MNPDQIINIIQTVFKVGGGMLASKGFLDNEKWEWISGLAIAIVTWILSHKWNATPSDPQGKLPLNLILFALVPAMLLSGCARMTVIQSKMDIDGATTETRTYVTTFFDAHSDIQKLKTTSTDKTQGVSVGSISEDTSGTNATALAENLVSAAVSAAVKSAK